MKRIYSILSLTILIFILNTATSYSQTKVSLEQMNVGKKYVDYSFGMGVTYSNNTSLVNFVNKDFPNFDPSSTTSNIKTMDVGVEFFGSAEFQLSQNWALRAEYSYFTKTISLPTGTFYSYGYNSHVPLLNLSYISRSDYIFFKFGVGGGYTYSTFTKSVSNIDSKYNASGFIIKPEITASLQLSKKVAGYISGFTDLRFSGDLKNDSGDLKTVSGETVNLNSQGVGLRLGLSIYVF